MATRRRRRVNCTLSESEFSEDEGSRQEKGYIRDSECESEIGTHEDLSEYESATEEHDDEDYLEDDESIIVESEYGDEPRESGDGQEQPDESVDDDLDRKNPAYVPRTGPFYEHDMRRGEEGDATIEDTDSDKKKRLWEDNRKWVHDKYDERQQGPKSRQEIVASYGYDIRQRDRPPEGEGRYSQQRRGRGSRGRRNRYQLREYITNAVPDRIDEDSEYNGPMEGGRYPSRPRRGFGDGRERRPGGRGGRGRGAYSQMRENNTHMGRSPPREFTNSARNAPPRASSTPPRYHDNHQRGPPPRQVNREPPPPEEAPVERNDRDRGSADGGYYDNDANRRVTPRRGPTNRFSDRDDADERRPIRGRDSGGAPAAPPVSQDVRQDPRYGGERRGGAPRGRARGAPRGPPRGRRETDEEHDAKLAQLMLEEEEAPPESAPSVRSPLPETQPMVPPPRTEPRPAGKRYSSQRQRGPPEAAPPAQEPERQVVDSPPAPAAMSGPPPPGFYGNYGARPALHPRLADHGGSSPPRHSLGPQAAPLQQQVLYTVPGSPSGPVTSLQAGGQVLPPQVYMAPVPPGLPVGPQGVPPFPPSQPGQVHLPFPAEQVPPGGVHMLPQPATQVVTAPPGLAAGGTPPVPSSQQPSEPAIQVRGGTTYFGPEVQQGVTNPAVPPGPPPQSEGPVHMRGGTVYFSPELQGPRDVGGPATRPRQVLQIVKPQDDVHPGSIVTPVETVTSSQIVTSAETDRLAETEQSRLPDSSVSDESAVTPNDQPEQTHSDSVTEHADAYPDPESSWQTPLDDSLDPADSAVESETGYQGDSEGPTESAAESEQRGTDTCDEDTVEGVATESEQETPDQGQEVKDEGNLGRDDSKAPDEENMDGQNSDGIAQEGNVSDIPANSDDVITHRDASQDVADRDVTEKKAGPPDAELVPGTSDDSGHVDDVTAGDDVTAADDVTAGGDVTAAPEQDGANVSGSSEDTASFESTADAPVEENKHGVEPTEDKEVTEQSAADSGDVIDVANLDDKALTDMENIIEQGLSKADNTAGDDVITGDVTASAGVTEEDNVRTGAAEMTVKDNKAGDDVSAGTEV